MHVRSRPEAGRLALELCGIRVMIFAGLMSVFGRKIATEARVDGLLLDDAKALNLYRETMFVIGEFDKHVAN